MSTWYNADGLHIATGQDRGRDVNRPNAVKTFGDEHIVKFDFDLSLLAAGVTTFTTDRDNDGTKDGFNKGDAYIPDQAHIISAVVYMTDTGGAGGTSIAVGTYQEDGTAIDADGLVTATNGAVANIGANVDQAGSGAQIGTAVTQNAYVGLTTAGTFTAGKGTVEIRYKRPRYV